MTRTLLFGTWHFKQLTGLAYDPFLLPDMKSQPESSVHSPFTKRQPYQTTTSSSSMLDVFLQDKGLPPSSAVSSSSSLPQQTTSSPHAVPPPASALPKMAVPSLGQQVSPSSSDAQSPLPLQQHKLKQQKKRTSITTKVTFILSQSTQNVHPVNVHLDVTLTQGSYFKPNSLKVSWPSL